MRTLGIVAAAALALSGCSASPPVDPAAPGVRPEPPPPAAAEALALFDKAPDEAYRIGEGDVLALHVWDRSDLSGTHVVGPDGFVSVPFAGPLRLAGLTREEASTGIRDALSRYYADAAVTVRVDQYVSNQVVVLGRVNAPGVLSFPARPTLLEAIARAGGLVRTPLGEMPALTRCAVVRGRDRVAWLDLRRLREDGDLTLNLRLRPHDLVFIPDWEDVPVYVLGQVARPGPIRWSPGLSVLDAVAQAGGLGRDAAAAQITLVRPSTGERFTIAQSELLRPELRANLGLKKGDILHVPTNILADVGYVFEKLNPFGWIFLAATVN